jgi:thiamine biosynthesis lipoprotein ApbE
MSVRSWRWSCLCGLLLVGGFGGGAAVAAAVSFHHDDVLGTSLEIVAEATDFAAAARAEAAVLGEIDRLAKVCSTYDPASEISRWLDSGEAREVSPDLAAILRACDRWRRASDGAFHPGVAVASRVWREAERAGSGPDEAQLRAVAAALRDAPWTWCGAAVAPRAASITVDGLGKGAIIDAACAAALGIEGVSGVLVNLGGDLAVRGGMEREVVVAAPDPAAVAGGLLDRVSVADRAIATSGDAFRGFTVAGRRHSHVIDPRSARPADGVRSATVVAAAAADADALATICCVLSPPESIRLVERIDGASCLILDREGVVHASRDWRGERFGPRRTAAAGVAFAADADGKPDERTREFVLDLEINRPAGGGRYRRPYVAVWVEDKDGFPVKTLLLWVQRDGQRWLPDLKRWYRADRLRKLAEETDLVATVSEATRQPGRHSVSWDGRDNAGAALPPGEYTICLEAAREHGTYQFDRRTVTLGGEPFREAFDGGTEIKAATFEERVVGGGR